MRMGIAGTVSEEFQSGSVEAAYRKRMRWVECGGGVYALHLASGEIMTWIAELP